MLTATGRGDGVAGFLRFGAVIAACLIGIAAAPVAQADPTSDSAPTNAAPTDGRVASGPPASLTTPDGWTMTLSSTGETAVPVEPLTTAVSSRDFIVGGTFVGALRGPDEAARGILEVGYDIGCGIDMTTSNGVSLTGTAGLTPSLGVSGPLGALPTAALPVISTPVGGAITVGLKPGLVNIVPVDKMEFRGNDPWVMVSNFHIKIDGCVGQSFIRSYATLTRQTDQSNAVLSWVGTTTTV
jgi:hypothetical protein